MYKPVNLLFGMAAVLVLSGFMFAIVSPTGLARLQENVNSSITSIFDTEKSEERAEAADPQNMSGISSFHFLQPLAPGSGDPSKFDPLLLNELRVEICRVNGNDCEVVKTFTSQSLGSERLRIERSYYLTAWDTVNVNHNNCTYRIRVMLPMLELGSVDLGPATYSRFGRSWPIKFLIEKDPVLRVRQLRSLGKSAAQIANVLKAEFGLTREQIVALLLADVEPFTQSQIDVALDGVFQEVIVPSTTKVSDDITRNALTSYTPESGRMVFGAETQQLRNLKIGDVIVSEPTEAAPYGYLRKVTFIRKSGQSYVVDTVQAQINEALSKGTLKASGELAPEDVLSSLSGESLSNRNLPVGDGDPGIANAGDGYNFHREIDVTIDLSTSGGGASGSGTVRVQGFVDFNAGYDFGVGVETCAEVPPVCVDRVEAHVGVTQKSYVKVTGQFDGTLYKEKEIDVIYFKPITFFIGPIPVVIVPIIEVIVGVDGEAHVSFRFEAETTSTLKLGAKWTDPGDGGNGWENIDEFQPLGGRIIDAGLTANMRVEAFGKSNAKLLLYGLIGPGISGRVGLRLQVQTGQRPWWILDGHLVGDVIFSADIAGVIDLGTYSSRVLDASFRIADAPNAGPQCSASSQPISANVGILKTLGPGTGFEGFFQCTDPEGESITYSAVSTLDGVIATNVGLIRYAFPTGGVRTVTVTAKDASNATTTFNLTVDVRNSLPIVNISSASTTVPATVQYFVTATAYDPEAGTPDPNAGFLTCDRIQFDASPNATAVKAGSGACGAVIRFNSVGTGTVTVTATDRDGGVGTAQLSVTVTPEPTNHPPEINPSFFNVWAYRGPATSCFDPNYYCLAPNNAVLYNGQAGSGDWYPPLLLDIGSVTDPDGDPITVTWYCKTGDQAVPIGYNQEYQFPMCTPVPSNIFEIKVYAIVSDGVNFKESPIRTYRMFEPLH